MRARHKSWQSDRPLKRNSRKVTWFQGHTNGVLSIRLNFDDEFGSSNRFYTTKEAAQDAYDAFIRGEFGALDAPYGLG